MKQLLIITILLAGLYSEKILGKWNCLEMAIDKNSGSSFVEHRSYRFSEDGTFEYVYAFFLYGNSTVQIVTIRSGKWKKAEDRYHIKYEDADWADLGSLKIPGVILISTSVYLKEKIK